VSAKRMGAVVGRINQILRGWTNYFRHAVCKHTLNRPRYFVNWRIIRWLRKRHRWRWKMFRRNADTAPQADSTTASSIVSYPRRWGLGNGSPDKGISSRLATRAVSAIRDVSGRASRLDESAAAPAAALKRPAVKYLIG